MPESGNPKYIDRLDLAVEGGHWPKLIYTGILKINGEAKWIDKGALSFAEYCTGGGPMPIDNDDLKKAKDGKKSCLW